MQTSRALGMKLYQHLIEVYERREWVGGGEWWVKVQQPTENWLLLPIFGPFGCHGNQLIGPTGLIVCIYVE